VNQADDPRWPYLSPSREGWTWVSGPRGHLRRLLLLSRAGESGADRTKAALDALEQLHGLARAADDDLLLLVTEAHDRGASWADIARRLGRSKQTVHQRFQTRVHERRTTLLLLEDLAQAERHARFTSTHATAVEDAARARAFLRRLGSATRRVR
jgi:AraC-like DNA-binding protein